MKWAPMVTLMKRKIHQGGIMIVKINAENDDSPNFIKQTLLDRKVSNRPK
jgi:hypothetical protein